MVFSDEMRDAAYSYSPSYKYSLGIELVDEKRAMKSHANFRYTYLLNRKNTRIRSEISISIELECRRER